jgi:hypothetical protein
LTVLHISAKEQRKFENQGLGSEKLINHVYRGCVEVPVVGAAEA